MNKKISLFPLTMLIIAAVTSVRMLPTNAFFGDALIFYYCIAAFLFLIPVVLISAEFASRSPEEGGVFYWIRSAFGSRIGVLAVWLQWINTVVWYPTMLLFIAGSAAHIFSPALAQNKLFLLLFSMGTFWTLTLLNLRGIQVSVKLNSLSAILGTFLPLALLFILSAFYLADHTSTLDYNTSLYDTNALVTVMASFLGMELAGAYIREIDNPAKTFPRAVMVAVLVVLAALMLGSLAVASVVPHEEIHFIDGLMQTFGILLQNSSLSTLTPVLALLMMLGAAGGSVNWLLSPAQGLLDSARHGFLPPYFLKLNRHGASQRILLLQAVVVSLFCGVLQLISSENIYYWLLMSLSTGLYMLMYILLFCAALKLGKPKEGDFVPFRRLCCTAGLFSGALTLIVTFRPPPNLVFSYYKLSILGAFTLMISPVFLLWAYQKREASTFLQKQAGEF